MEDSLYEWNVKLFKVDQDSLLAGDLKELQSKTGKDHIAGIYHWVNKIYNAQILNYGKRTMAEFIVPEPAAFYLFAKGYGPEQVRELIQEDLRGELTPPAQGTVSQLRRRLASFR